MVVLRFLVLAGLCCQVPALADGSGAVAPGARGGIVAFRAQQNPDPITGVLHLVAGPSRAVAASFAGDCRADACLAACDARLPLLCYRDIDAPKPASLASGAGWTGGIVATTPAVPGSQFAAIREAHAFCRAQFGPGWRVLTVQDGSGKQLLAYGNMGDATAAWLNDLQRPALTCWGSRP